MSLDNLNHHTIQKRINVKPKARALSLPKYSFANVKLITLSTSIFLCLLFMALSSKAAQMELKLKIVDVSDNLIKTSKAHIILDDNEINMLRSQDANLNVKLDYNKDFIVVIDAEGYEPSEIHVDTRLPDEMLKYVYEYTLTIKLIPSRRGFDVQYTGDPAVYLAYKRGKDSFGMINPVTPSYSYIPAEDRTIIETDYLTSDDLPENQNSEQDNSTSNGGSNQNNSTTNTNNNTETYADNALQEVDTVVQKVKVEDDPQESDLASEQERLKEYRTERERLREETFVIRDIQTKEEKAEIALQEEEERRIVVENRMVMAQKRRNLFEEIADSKRFIKQEENGYSEY